MNDYSECWRCGDNEFTCPCPNNRPVTDHEYWGNVCIGFGGKSECREYTDGGQCNRPEWEHDYRPPKHKGEYNGETSSGMRYRGKHVRDSTIFNLEKKRLADEQEWIRRNAQW